MPFDSRDEAICCMFLKQKPTESALIFTAMVSFDVFMYIYIILIIRIKF